MKGSILLSGEHVELARAELSAVLRSMGFEMEPAEVDGRLVIFDDELPKGAVQRMGLGHFSSQEIISSGKSKYDIIELIECLLDTVRMGETVSVKVISPGGSGYLLKRELFELFCSRAFDRGMVLKHRGPNRRFYIYVGKSVHGGVIRDESDRKSIRSRAGPQLPFSRPIIMEPKLARVLVNLSELPRGSLILDPFLGCASLAMEAAILGYRVVGVERDREILKGARKNISFMGLSSVMDSHHGDSREIGNEPWWMEIDHVDGIVTDPPFGKSAPLMGEDPSKLLRDVIGIAAEKLRPGAPLVLDTDRRENLHILEDFILKAEYNVKVHGSMTRTIGVLRKKG